jgi:hypothetical protein
MSDSTPTWSAPWPALPEENRDLDLIKPYYAIAEALVEYGIEHVGLKKVEVTAAAQRVLRGPLRSTLA